MEERVARLESSLHKLLCCTPPVVGPQGPQGPMGNPGDNLSDSSTELFNQYYTASTVALTTLDLNTLFPDLLPGQQVFAPYQPGGLKIFVKTAFSWYSTNLTIVT